MGLVINNIIDKVDDGKFQRRDFDGMEGFAIHRCGLDLQTGVVLGYDAVSVCKAFQGLHPNYPEVKQATGGQNPYTIIIGGDCGPPEYDGVIWQCLPLDEIGHHARRFSVDWLGIGLIADPREKAISEKQRMSLVDLLVELCIGWNKSPMLNIEGHGEIDGAHGGEKAPGKPAWCPGFDLGTIRQDVATLVRERGRRRLAQAGLVFAG